MKFDRSSSFFLSILLFFTSCGTHINHNSENFYDLNESEEYSIVKSRDFIAFHYFIHVDDQIYELSEIMKYQDNGEFVISGIPNPPLRDHLLVKAMMDSIPLQPVSELMLSYIPQIHLKLKTDSVVLGERINLTDSDIRRITIYYHRKDNSSKATLIVVGGLVVLAGLIFYGLQNMKFSY